MPPQGWPTPLMMVTIEKLRQYDALTPVQDERPNERDPFMGHASCSTSPTKKRALDTDNPVQSVPHVQESTCNLTKIFYKSRELCNISERERPAHMDYFRWKGLILGPEYHDIIKILAHFILCSLSVQYI